jgi:hypothetical protein
MAAVSLANFCLDEVIMKLKILFPAVAPAMTTALSAHAKVASDSSSKRSSALEPPLSVFCDIRPGGSETAGRHDWIDPAGT